jgi:hypothetical protein
VATAVRFRFSIGADGTFDLINSPTALDKFVPGGDTLPMGPLAGLWVDVVDDRDEVLYARVLDTVPDGTQEVFSPDPPTVTRVRDARAVRNFLVYVPDIGPQGQHLLQVHRTDPTRADRTARIIARIPF